MDTKQFISKKKFPMFNRLDQQSGDYIAAKIFQKYKTQEGVLDQSSIKKMIEDAYKIINKEHQADREEIEHYIDHFSIDNQSYLTIKDIESVCKNQLVGPKGYGLNIIQNKCVQLEDIDCINMDKNIKTDNESLTEEKFSNISKQQTCKSIIQNYNNEKIKKENDSNLQHQNISQLVREFKKQEKLDKNLNIINFIMIQSQNVKNLIMKDLQEIERICNEKDSIENSLKLREYIKEVLEWIDQNINTIEKMYLTHVLQLKKDKKFSSVFEDPIIGYHMNNNLAFFEQNSWKDNDQSQNFEYLKNGINILKRKNLKIESTDDEDLLKKIKNEYTLVNNFLQLAACYSQYNKHYKALKCGKNCLKYLSSMIQNIKNLFKNSSFYENQAIKDMNQQDVQDLSICFEQIFTVILQINFKLKEELQRPFKQENTDQTFFEQFEKIQFTKKIKKISIDWVQQMTIVYFMHIQFVSLKKIKHQLQLKEIFSETFLSLIILLSSTIYFMISTENRFICTDEDFTQKKNFFKIKTVFENNHLERIKKMRKYKFSRILHSKAIYILQTYLEESVLLKHFLGSYYKNFQTNKELGDIIEEEEETTKNSVKQQLENNSNNSDSFLSRSESETSIKHKEYSHIPKSSFQKNKRKQLIQYNIDLSKNLYKKVKKKKKIRNQILYNSVDKCNIANNNIVIIGNFNTKNNIYIDQNSTQKHFHQKMKKSFSQQKPILSKKYKIQPIKRSRINSQPIFIKPIKIKKKYEFKEPKVPKKKIIKTKQKSKKKILKTQKQKKKQIKTKINPTTKFDIHKFLDFQKFEEKSKRPKTGLKKIKTQHKKKKKLFDLDYSLDNIKRYSNSQRSLKKQQNSFSQSKKKFFEKLLHKIQLIIQQLIKNVKGFILCFRRKFIRRKF